MSELEVILALADDMAAAISNLNQQTYSTFIAAREELIMRLKDLLEVK